MTGSISARSAVFLATLVLACGCVSVPRESLDIQRYAIDPEPREEAMGPEPQPLTIRVLPFGAGASLRGDRILFRDRTHRLDPYFY
ncbi:MAG: hypothetical protein GF346_13285, partial [Candidatus Eisenbacteria bacterium]|nr:hypothetical protein [Candidatus Latescibacterota bacterium]MBD3303413.1 hypothetical protein [Candidatus Eisenbacteria bacterium]